MLGTHLGLNTLRARPGLLGEGSADAGGASAGAKCPQGSYRSVGGGS